MGEFWSAFTAWLAKGQLGVIPEWFNGLSLLLALYLFLRSRRSDDRALVDKVGLWLTTEWKRQYASPLGTAERIDEGKVTLHARNASDVPVELHQVAFRVASRWAVRDEAIGSGGEHTWTITPGVDETRSFAYWTLLAPGESRKITDGGPVNVAHHARPIGLIASTGGGA